MVFKRRVVGGSRFRTLWKRFGSLVRERSFDRAASTRGVASPKGRVRPPISLRSGDLEISRSQLRTILLILGTVVTEGVTIAGGLIVGARLTM